MFKNFIVIALRNLRRNPLYSLINIFGLSLGIACCLILASMVVSMINQNKSLPDSKQLHQLVKSTEIIESNQKITGNYIERNDLKTITNNIPELESGSELNSLFVTIDTENNQFSETIHHTDKNFTRIFPIDLVSGDLGLTLSKPGEILISQAMAQKFFNNKNPIGESFTIDGKLSLIVSGVYKNFPPQSILDNIHFLTCYCSVENLQGHDLSDLSGSTRFYIKLNNANLEDLQQRASEHMENTSPNILNSAKIVPLVKPLSYYLSSDSMENQIARYVLLFALGLCLIVLFTSCINFINLTTARQSQRSLEVGIRKTSGAGRWQLMMQFFSETAILVVIACLIALPLMFGLFYWISHFTDNSMDLSFLYSGEFFIAIGIIIFFTSFLSGFYPALVLSRFNPIQALTGRSETLSTGKLRKILVVAQFSIATILVTCCLIVHFQIVSLKNTDNGIDQESLFTIDNGSSDQDKWPAYREILINELAQWPEVSSLSASFKRSMIGAECEFNEISLNDGEQGSRLIPVGVDGNYAAHYGIELLAGRHLDIGRPEDLGKIDPANNDYRDTAILLTRKGLKTIGKNSAKEVINQKILCNDKAFALTIVGVADAYKPLFKNGPTFQPDMIYLDSNANGGISAKYNNTTFSQIREKIEDFWEKLYPTDHLNYISDKKSMEDSFQALFIMLWSIGGFGVLAILISLLGLYAMSIFTVARRTKEIGIRKALGASSPSIVYDLIRDTCKPVLISLAIASPVSYLIGSLAKQYFYQTPPIALISFVITPILLLTISVLSVYWHSQRAADTNPVKALRYE